MYTSQAANGLATRSLLFKSQQHETFEVQKLVT